MDWSIIAPGIGGFLGSFLVLWLLRRLRANEPTQTQLKTGKGAFWLLIIISPLMLALAFWGGYAFSVGTEDHPGNMLLGLGAGLFLALIGLGGLWQAFDGRTRWANWDEQTLTVNSGSGPPRSYAWNRVSSMSRIEWMKAWKIKFDDDSTFLFSETMIGGNDLLELCNAQIRGET